VADALSDLWVRFDASDWELAGEEPQGLQEHPWLRHVSRRRPWLFKAVEPHQDRPLTNDIVEKLASEIAATLGVPAAQVDLVTRATTRGCLVETLRPSGWVLQAGQVLLGGVLDDYDPNDRGHSGYNVFNVRRALDGFGPPPTSPVATGLDAFGVFTGYLLLDALIANTDRHDRNWAVLVPPPGDDGPNTLCGSYDHGSSLGFNLSDEKREQLLGGQTVDDWTHRATARQFEHIPGAPRRNLVDVAQEAVHLCTAQALQHWRNAFLSLTDGQLEAIVVDAPSLTAVTRRFTIELLQVNRRRVLNVLT
jgi:hypothetical protein